MPVVFSGFLKAVVVVFECRLRVEQPSPFKNLSTLIGEGIELQWHVRVVAGGVVFDAFDNPRVNEFRQVLVNRCASKARIHQLKLPKRRHLLWMAQDALYEREARLLRGHIQHFTPRIQPLFNPCIDIGVFRVGMAHMSV